MSAQPQASVSPRVAIIAGAGRFPFHVAQEATRQGVPVVAMGLQGWADPSLAAAVQAYEEVAVGRLGTLIDRLKAHGVRQAVMAGKVTKAILLDDRTDFDPEALAILRHARDLSVSSVLGAIATRLAADDITLLDSSTFLRDSLCPSGALTARRPTPGEEDDIRLGVQVARAVAAMDVGQTVVVKQRVIVAVEALEGTDAAIRRAHQLAGRGLVVVKMASPTQDRRFDLPVVGTDTVRTLLDAGVACLAVEAGATLLLDRATIVGLAEASDLCLVGVSP